MKKLFFALFLIGISLLSAEGQNNAAFTSVPVVNGNVVFEQFIHPQNTGTADQKFTALSDWAKKKYTGNPRLSGIRFDERARTMTVSLRTDLGIAEGVSMNYRFDITISNAGGMVVIRDISFQVPQAGSAIPTTLSATQMITDQAIALTDENSTLRNNTRRACLAHFNALISEIEGVIR